jgi:hypothetical protein
MLLTVGQEVIIQDGDGQSLCWVIGKKAKIIHITKNFIFVDVKGYGIRASLIDYVEPVLTMENRNDKATIREVGYVG